MVEIFFIDEGKSYDIIHPMHMHGHAFYVIAMERHGIDNTYVSLLPKKNKSLGNATILKL